MRRQLFLIMICATLLAACGGNNPAPTGVAQQNSAATAVVTDAPTAIPPTAEARVYATGQPTLLPAGTIIPPATEDPDVGKPYDSVSLFRTGGIEGKPLEVVLLGNGNVTRDGVASVVSADQVKLITDLLDQMGFIDMQGIFQGVGTSPDIYTYRISVERNGSSRAITAQDGFMPPQLGNLVALLSSLGATQ